MTRCSHNTTCLPHDLLVVCVFNKCKPCAHSHYHVCGSSPILVNKSQPVDRKDNENKPAFITMDSIYDNCLAQPKHRWLYQACYVKLEIVIETSRELLPFPILLLSLA